MKLIKVIWNVLANPQLKNLVADILDVYADLFRGDIPEAEALEKIVELVKNFIFNK